MTGVTHAQYEMWSNSRNKVAVATFHIQEESGVVLYVLIDIHEKTTHGPVKPAVEKVGPGKTVYNKDDVCDLEHESDCTYFGAQCCVQHLDKLCGAPLAYADEDSIHKELARYVMDSDPQKAMSLWDSTEVKRAVRTVLQHLKKPAAVMSPVVEARELLEEALAPYHI